MNLLRYYSDEGQLIELDVETIASYLVDESRKIELSDFIYERHYRRYIKPFEYISEKKVNFEREKKPNDEYSLLYKNGFSIMANCCLLIETLEAFYRGFPDTKGKSQQSFFQFFSRDKNFIDFATDDIPTQFYSNIRCGILHQGETTHGWSITRDSKFILDKDNKTINATMFLAQLKNSLKDYRNELNEADWNDNIWKNTRTKLKSIIKNTK